MTVSGDILTGIEDVNHLGNLDSLAKTYNLARQKVGNDYKGIVNSGSQKFCSEHCEESAKREREKKVSDFMRAVEPIVEVSRQEYLTFSKAAVLMGCCWQYIYKLVNSGKLPASRLSSRMSLVRRADIEAMLSGNPYHRVLPFYNSKTAVRSYAHWHGITTKRKYGITYYSKSHFDELRWTDLTNDERYCTVGEVAKRYGMTTSNVCVIIKKHGVEREKTEAIRCRRYESIVNERYDFFDKRKMKGDFLEYFRQKAEKHNHEQPTV